MYYTDAIMDLVKAMDDKRQAAVDRCGELQAHQDVVAYMVAQEREECAKLAKELETVGECCFNQISTAIRARRP